MNKLRLTLITLMILGIFTALFAQTPPVSVVFTNTNNTTYTLLNQEYPGGAYPLGATGVRWVAQYYLDGGDGVNSPLDPATKLPTGDDALLTNPNNNQIVTIGTAPTRPWTSGGISFPYSATEINGLVGATIYVRIFNSTTIETATKYIQFNGHYTVGTGAVQSVNILTNAAMSAFGWSAWTPLAVTPTEDYPAGVLTPTTTPGVSIVVDLGANIVAAPTQPAPPAIGNAAGYVHQEVLELLGPGPWEVVYTTMAPYGAWYSYVTGMWTTVPNVGGTITFIIPVGGKSIPEVPIILGDSTLPVTFSSFAATLTAQNFVKLTWVTESESNLSGYYVLRSETTDLANAVKLSQLIEATNSSSTQTYSIVDSEVVPQTTYYYWLESVEMNGSSNYHGPTNVYVEAGQPITPSLITTMGNAYPNPFKANSNTNIAYEVKAGETGTITIYNVIGQVVKVVPVSETTTPRTFTWNGRDSKGNVCGSGIYFYKLSTPSRNITKKMVIVN